MIGSTIMQSAHIMTNNVHTYWLSYNHMSLQTDNSLNCLKSLKLYVPRGNNIDIDDTHIPVVLLS